MVNKIKKSIQDSKRKRDFKHRQKVKEQKHKKEKMLEETKYTQKRRKSSGAESNLEEDIEVEQAPDA